jgi:GH15 family glucan-1,4-alpha-glucosidase
MRWCVLGNSSLYLGFDKRGWLREMFWPVVGLANHVAEGTENHVMIWYQGRFHVVGGNDWALEGKYGAGMSFSWTLAHQTMPISMLIRDCVDPYSPIWARSITLDNGLDNEQFGLYFKQYYNLGENTIGECGFWDSSRRRLYHFKGPNWVGVDVAVCQDIGDEWPGQDSVLVTSGAVAKRRDGGIRLSPGTGEVFGRPIDHGLIESIYAVKWENYKRPAGGSKKIEYFLAFGRNRGEVDALLDAGLEKGFEGVCKTSCRFWNGKLGQENPSSLYDISVKIAAAHCDSRGGVLASCDTDIMSDYRDHYRYVWPRDAAMCASILSRAGMPEYGRRYLQFCLNTISQEGFFWQRYRPDGTRGSSWHEPNLPEGDYPIQEDQLSLSLITALDYVELTGDLEFVSLIYPGFVKKGAQFVQRYRLQNGCLVRPSFDLWEERRGIFTFTQAVSALALASAAKIAWSLGQPGYREYLESVFSLLEGCVDVLSDDSRGFCRGIVGSGPQLDWTEDASLFLALLSMNRIGEIIATFPGQDLPGRVKPALEAIEARGRATWLRLHDALMVYISGKPCGIARYPGDWYQRPQGGQDLPGNPWFVTTAWYVMSGLMIGSITTAQAMDWLDWFRHMSLEPGILSEQINGVTGTPLSVAPLVWSHGAYIELSNLVESHLLG